MCALLTKLCVVLTNVVLCFAACTAEDISIAIISGPLWGFVARLVEHVSTTYILLHNGLRHRMRKDKVNTGLRMLKLYCNRRMDNSSLA